MSYSGLLSSKKSAKFKTPALTQITVGGGGTSSATRYPYGYNTMYTVGEMTYYVNYSSGAVLYWPLHDPSDVYSDPNKILSASSISVTTPSPVGDYIYGYGGSGGRQIYRAHKDSPSSWEITSSTLNFDARNATVYVDSSYIYLYGSGGTSLGDDGFDIHRAPISSPTSFTGVGTLPGLFIGMCMVNLGGSLYFYGGATGTGTKQTNIWTASTSSPEVVTDTGGSLPTASSFMTYWSDGASYFYLYQGGTTQTEIYQVPYGFPTTPSIIGVSPGSGGGATSGYCPVFQVGTNILMYVRISSFYNTSSIYKATTSNPYTFTDTAPYNLPAARYASAVGSYKNRLVVLGGYDSTPSATSTVYINDSNLKAVFADSGSTLSGPSAGGQMVRTSKYMYVVGGGAIYRASLSDLSTWSYVDSSGPNVSYGQVAIIDNFIYYFGGELAGTPVTDVYRSIIRDGEIVSNNWDNTLGFVLPATLSRFAFVRAGSWAYIFGGYTGAAINTTVYRAPVSSLSSWTNIGTVAGMTASPIVFLHNGILHLVGGDNSTAFNAQTSNTALKCSFSDLLMGRANFFTDSNVSGGGISAGTAIFLGSRLMIPCSKVSASPVSVIRTNGTTVDFDVMDNTTVGSKTIVCTDSESGGVVPISAQQVDGMLPWRVTDY